MLFNDQYQTIAKISEGIFRDKGSKFIAYACPLQTESEVKELITNLKAEHPKARHHCWAWRLSPDRTVFKLHDDGEPSGTAGRPILNTLLSRDVTNILVVVVRYFGGTLLGVPGLINAYKSATAAALEANEIIIRAMKDVYELQFDYPDMNAVMRIIKEEELTVLNQDFDNRYSIKVAIRQSSLSQVIGKLEKIENLKTKYLKTI